VNRGLTSRPDVQFDFNFNFKFESGERIMCGIDIGRNVAVVALAALTAAGVPAPLAGQRDTEAAADDIARREMEARYILPPAPIAEYFARNPNYARLDAPSPDGKTFLIPLATELSTLELMARPTYRLAELEIRPATDRLWHLDTYGITGFRFYDLDTKRFRDVALPAGTFVSDMVWSPDGTKLAFLAHLPSHTEVWTADVATGRAQRFADARVLATLGTSAQTSVEPSRMLQWTPEGTILTLMVPAHRGPEPMEDAVPDGPMVRLTRPAATSSRTYSNLLRDPHDATLFEHYTRAQLVELAAGRAPRPIGEPRMYESISLSPDGRHILASTIERPFSFLTSYQGFPHRTLVLDRQGAVLATLEETALREGGGRGGSGGLDQLAWRPDGAGLSFVKSMDGDDAIMLLSAPFDTAAAREVARSEDDISDVTYARDGSHAFATVSKSGEQGIAHWRLGDTPERHMLIDFHEPDSLFTLPGELWTQRTPNGTSYALLSSGADAVYLRGPGYAADYRPRPFVDRVTLADGERTRVFTGAPDSYDQPVVALDADLLRMIVSREGVHDFPDSFLWTRADGALANLTNNVDPFPELTAARRIDFSFTRRDGLQVQGRVSLPLDYREGEKVPAIFWTYPREYTTPDGYTRSAVEARNRNAYTALTWLRWSDLWLTQGYALVYPDIPIIGENYNDTYISNMVDAMYGAMRAVDKLGVIDMDRIGHGGHSYGAFATANLLAHTPFFKAGIAGDGAYNRSLTPSGFQAESRPIWEAPSTYIEMSPFFAADQINTPLLMYHGADDNNTGTWPIQSERLMHALTGLGKTAALYMYPFESHTPRAIENNLDMWARWIDWFDRYVKGQPAAQATTSSSGAR
jgi:dipeptidyl aminopeptidase/acylaminoacyl peptidase